MRLISAILVAVMVWVAAGCVKDVTRENEIQQFRQYLQQSREGLNVDLSRPLTMAQCEEIALTNSLDLRVSTMSLGLQDEQVRLAISGGLPNATLVYTDNTRSNRNLARQNGVVSQVEDRHQQRLAIAAIMPALDWGLTYHAWKMAVDQKRQQELIVERSRQLLRRDVRVGYARYAGAVRQEKLASIAYKAGEQVLRVAKSLEKESLTVPADTALVEAALAEAGLSWSQSRRNVQQTYLTLSQLMSLPPSVHFTIDEAYPAVPPPPTTDEVRAMAERALTVRPELSVQDLQRHISAHNVLAEATAFFPRVDLTGSFNWTSMSTAVNPAYFGGGFLVSHALLDGGATLWRYNLARKQEDIEKQKSLLTQLGVLYDVQLRALTVQDSAETVNASRVLERSRKAGLDRIVSLFMEGLEDEAGAARSLADLTVQATILDQAQTDYLAAWYELEAACLPEESPTERTAAAAASQPSSAPANVAWSTEMLPVLPELGGNLPSTTTAPASQPTSSEGM